MEYDQDHILSRANSSAFNYGGGHMPYPAGHRAKIRQKIVLAARRLFNQRGFENVSINEIMGAAGLTRGGFYSYFASKTELYAETLACFFTDPTWKNTWKGVEIDLNAAPVGPQIVRAYLSRQHFENVKDSCPMVALPSDVARAGKAAKRAFEGVFAAMVSFLERDVRHCSRDTETAAQAIAALCVGGKAIARAMDDRGHAGRLRDACEAVALRLGGWEEKAEKGYTY
jgi:AcrR family transcriptional regulator